MATAAHLVVSPDLEATPSSPQATSELRIASPFEEPGVGEEIEARALRILEAVLFAASQPLTQSQLAEHLPDGVEVGVLIKRLGTLYAGRGIVLQEVAGGYAFRTAPDLARHLTIYRSVTRRFSRAALEALAILAYHQPITRSEIEAIRGVSLSRGTLDQLLEAGWIKPKGRRAVPGRPVTWVTTPEFLSHFGLNSLDDLPGVEELKAAGLLDPIAASLPGLAQLDGEEGEAVGDAETEEGPHGDA